MVLNQVKFGNPMRKFSKKFRALFSMSYRETKKDKQQECATKHVSNIVHLTFNNLVSFSAVVSDDPVSLSAVVRLDLLDEFLIFMPEVVTCSSGFL